MLSFECIKNEKSVYFLLTSAILGSHLHYTAHVAQHFIQLYCSGINRVTKLLLNLMF